MTNHQKRLSVPDSWPVERKTETFTVKAGAGPHGEDGVPLLILLRDVLEYVDNRKEARYALNEDNVVINGTAVRDEERPVGMFDIIAFTEREEFYRVFPDEGGRLALTPIDDDSAGSKLGKIIGKQTVPGGEVQLTLHDGQTLLVDDPETYSVDDSIVVANDDDAIVAHFEYEEGALATAVAGQHAGQIGEIEEIQVTASSAQNNVLLSAHEGDEPFETIEEYVVVIDENFIEDDSEPAAGEPVDASETVDESEEEDAAEADDDGEDETEAEEEDAAEAEDEEDADADDEAADAEAEEDADADDEAADAEAEEDADADDEAADAEAEEDADADDEAADAEAEDTDDATDSEEGDT